MPGGRSDEPLDIGAIPLEVFPFHEPRVGDLAPTFAAKAPDGRPLDLAAHRGKFVLLHFWSGRPEDAAIIPHLKAVHAAFGRDPRFVMIGWIADETPGPVRRYAAHHGLSWEQQFIGSTYDPNPFEAAFGVWFPPMAFLIGPDGRILAKDLQGEAIEHAVARALERQPQPRAAAEPPRADRMLKLEVVDGTDRSPLAGAAVLVRVTRGQAHTSQGATDEEGRFSIALAGDTTYFLYVVVAHPGFVPIELRWDGSSIPGAYTLAMRARGDDRRRGARRAGPADRGCPRFPRGHQHGSGPTGNVREHGGRDRRGVDRCRGPLATPRPCRRWRERGPGSTSASCIPTIPRSSISHVRRRGPRAIARADYEARRIGRRHRAESDRPAGRGRDGRRDGIER